MGLVGLGWFGLVWFGFWFGLAWFGLVWYIGFGWFGLVWVSWFGLVLFGSVRFSLSWVGLCWLLVWVDLLNGTTLPRLPSTLQCTLTSRSSGHSLFVSLEHPKRLVSFPWQIIFLNPTDPSPSLRSVL